MFNARELMVNLAAYAGGGVAANFIRCFASCHYCSGTCYDGSWTGPIGCGFSGCGITLTIVEAAPAADPATKSQQLSALKEQLKQAVADIEKQEGAS
jgi:hypothetical protein